jgi:hypothetical protein
MPLTEGQEYGLLPTPMAQERNTTEEQTLQRKEKYGGMKRAMYLENYAVMGLLPTPTASAIGECQSSHQLHISKDGVAKPIRKSGVIGNSNLYATLQVRGMLPTPQAQEGDKITGLENQDSITKRVREMTGQTSQLNPQFVAEMMGFPTDWTELPFLNGEQKA